ncbi:carbohydrate ABC transporter permease [Cellulomonas sp. zg-ZUI199]|uniref:Carbohydrate ABC transporter permease n=1 Tax=Cellulomonas wangleii TaxID=2816956 RepID=A0ABX8D6W1_9CELL|nr:MULTISPECIES: carbohydrate ABC transporter permease [Cellulomonas]MBO0901096.1 carbohydrate ABC transporter permease [Cellulomonas sp. zg-ZUI22]MBO0926703.1 carbohydrate ABC transporter permease [Cellulomonas wangleii]QVI63178.1 carbohydrate ABC transporter permease [Cellulomonas wangleii]
MAVATPITQAPPLAAGPRSEQTNARTLKAFRASPATYAVLLVVSAMFFVPFVLMVSIALASDATSATNMFTIIPTEFEWSNFASVFTATGLPVGRFVLNSVIIATLAAVGQVLSSSLVGYAFARLRAPGKNVMFMVVLATMMIPAQITMIPQFLLFKELGWVNTFLPLIVPNFFSNAFNVFLVRQFVSRVSGELDEAAQVDGLGYFGIYRRIVLPMMWPILTAIAIFTLTAAWGDFMGPLIYLNQEDMMPLALGLQFMTSTSNAMQLPPWNLVMVGSILLTVPMIAVYYAGQKYLYEMNLSGGSAGVK